MNIGILLPGFSSDENDWAIPVQMNLVREMAKGDDVRVLALRYPHRRDVTLFMARRSIPWVLDRYAACKD